MVAVILAEAGGQISCGWSPLRSTNELRDWAGREKLNARNDR